MSLIPEQATSPAEEREPLKVEFKIYEPFQRPDPDGSRHLVIYAHRSNGTRRRIGSVDMGPGDMDAFLAMWAEAGQGVATAEDLGFSR